MLVDNIMLQVKSGRSC